MASSATDFDKKRGRSPDIPINCDDSDLSSDGAAKRLRVRWKKNCHSREKQQKSETDAGCVAPNDPTASRGTAAAAASCSDILTETSEPRNRHTGGQRDASPKLASTSPPRTATVKDAKQSSQFPLVRRCASRTDDIRQSEPVEATNPGPCTNGDVVVGRGRCQGWRRRTRKSTATAILQKATAVPTSNGNSATRARSEERLPYQGLLQLGCATRRHRGSSMDNGRSPSEATAAAQPPASESFRKNNTDSSKSPNDVHIPVIVVSQSPCHGAVDTIQHIAPLGQQGMNKCKACRHASPSRAKLVYTSYTSPRWQRRLVLQSYRYPSRDTVVTRMGLQETQDDVLGQKKNFDAKAAGLTFLPRRRSELHCATVVSISLGRSSLSYRKESCCKEKLGQLQQPPSLQATATTVELREQLAGNLSVHQSSTSPKPRDAVLRSPKRGNIVPARRYDLRPKRRHSCRPEMLDATFRSRAEEARRCQYLGVLLSRSIHDANTLAAKHDYFRFFQGCPSGRRVSPVARRAILLFLIEIGRAIPAPVSDFSLHMAINLFDRYLSCLGESDDDAMKERAAQQLEAVGAACLFICSKLEDCWTLSLGDICKTFDQGSDKRKADILFWELEISRRLSFALCSPTLFDFLYKMVDLALPYLGQVVQKTSAETTAAPHHSKNAAPTERPAAAAASAQHDSVTTSSEGDEGLVPVSVDDDEDNDDTGPTSGVHKDAWALLDNVTVQQMSPHTIFHPCTTTERRPWSADSLAAAVGPGRLGFSSPSYFRQRQNILPTSIGNDILARSASIGETALLHHTSLGIPAHLLAAAALLLAIVQQQEHHHHHQHSLGSGGRTEDRSIRHLPQPVRVFLGKDRSRLAATVRTVSAILDERAAVYTTTPEPSRQSLYSMTTTASSPLGFPSSSPSPTPPLLHHHRSTSPEETKNKAASRDADPMVAMQPGEEEQPPMSQQELLLQH